MSIPAANRLTCPHCPKHKTKRYSGEQGLADHILAVHPAPLPGDGGDDISTADVYRYMRQERVQQGERHRQGAEQVYQDAAQFASGHGMRLKQLDPAHYQLVGPDNSLLNIYPGNQRLYHDPNRPKPPYLKLPEPWTLLDVVKSAAGVGELEMPRDGYDGDAISEGEWFDDEGLSGDDRDPVIEACDGSAVVTIGWCEACNKAVKKIWVDDRIVECTACGKLLDLGPEQEGREHDE